MSVCDEIEHNTCREPLTRNSKYLKYVHNICTSYNKSMCILHRFFFNLVKNRFFQCKRVKIHLNIHNEPWNIGIGNNMI